MCEYTKHSLTEYTKHKTFSHGIHKHKTFSHGIHKNIQSRNTQNTKHSVTEYTKTLSHRIHNSVTEYTKHLVTKYTIQSIYKRTTFTYRHNANAYNSASRLHMCIQMRIQIHTNSINTRNALRETNSERMGRNQHDDTKTQSQHVTQLIHNEKQ